MAIDAYLQKDTTPPTTIENHFLSLEDDGYYWFLHEFFEELAAGCGQMIDLYGDAFFKGENLNLLNHLIQCMRKTVSEKPNTWDEFVGTTFEKGEKTKAKKRFTTVRKKELETVLTKLENAIVEAKAKNIGIFFCGD